MYRIDLVNQFININMFLRVHFSVENKLRCDFSARKRGISGIISSMGIIICSIFLLINRLILFVKYK